jgi:hypothetical protein
LFSRPCCSGRKELIEVKNEADTLLYSADKNLSEHKAALPTDVVTAIETAQAGGVLRRSTAPTLKR